MSDASTNSDRDAAGEVDPGEPIAALAGFEHDVPVGFLGQIRRAIGRRTAAVHVTLFALDMPILVLKEFWLIVIELFDPKKSRKDAGT